MRAFSRGSTHLCKLILILLWARLYLKRNILWLLVLWDPLKCSQVIWNAAKSFSQWERCWEEPGIKAPLNIELWTDTSLFLWCFLWFFVLFVFNQSLACFFVRWFCVWYIFVCNTSVYNTSVCVWYICIYVIHLCIIHHLHWCDLVSEGMRLESWWVLPLLCKKASNWQMRQTAKNTFVFSALFPSSSLGEALNFEEARVDTSQLTSGQHVIQNRGTAEHKTDPTV